MPKLLGWPLSAPRFVSRDFYFTSPPGQPYIDGRHGGVDLVKRTAAETTGTPLLAVDDGVCFGNGWDVSGQRGYLFSTDTDSGFRVGYAHMRAPSHIQPGQRVRRGEVVGYADSTGNVTGPHLHIDVWARAKRSPEAYLSVIGWWKHDPILQFSDLPPVEPPVEEDDMTPEEHEWLRIAASSAANVDRETDTMVQQWPWMLVALVRAHDAVMQNHAILFDDLSNDAAADKRRLIGIGQQVKALKDRGLTAEERAALTKIAAAPNTPVLLRSALQKVLV